MTDFMKKNKTPKSLSLMISRSYINEADEARTRNLRIDRLVFRL